MDLVLGTQNSLDVPGESKAAKKLTYVTKVDSGGKALVVGSGIYLD